MGKLRRIGLACLLTLLAVACSSKSAGTPEDLARMAFEALKEGSPRPVRGCLATIFDIEDVMDLIREKADREVYEAAQVYVDEHGGAGKLAVEMRDKFRESLEQTLERLGKSATRFDWSKADFDGIAEGRSEELIEGGLEKRDITFQVKVGDHMLTFELDDCVKVDRGWLCRTIRLLKAPGYEVKPGD